MHTSWKMYTWCAHDAHTPSWTRPKEKLGFIELLNITRDCGETHLNKSNYLSKRRCLGTSGIVRVKVKVILNLIILK